MKAYRLVQLSYGRRYWANRGYRQGPTRGQRHGGASGNLD